MSNDAVCDAMLRIIWYFDNALFPFPDNDQKHMILDVLALKTQYLRFARNRFRDACEIVCPRWNA